ncbi:MAG TPA: gluconokinase [Ktedonobacteraceae bacterium]|nr:gluconokinase [Ktedonobacteraceae bacterium]
MAHPGCTIGIDIGTSSVKAIAFDADMQAIAHAAEKVESWHDDAGAADQDPMVVYQSVMAVLISTSQEAQRLGYTVERVGLSAAMHSLIPVAADGTNLAPSSTWMDLRGKEEASALWKTPAGQSVYERTGTPIHPMTPLLKLMWMRKHQPEIFQAAAKFVSQKEWIWYQWFGEWRVDASLASATGLYNLQQGNWDAGALSLAGIAVEKLSTIVPTTYMKQGMREPRLLRSGIVSETVFNIGASDGVLANLGLGAVGSELMVMTMGTSCAVRAGSSKPFTDVSTRSFCYVLDTGRFIVGGPSNSGGIVLDWLYHSVLSRNPADRDPQRFVEMITAAESVPGDDLLCLPYVAGERAPLWNADASGVFFGLQLHHTGPHLMRAAIEGMVLNAYWIASGLFQELGHPRQLIASGKVLETEWIRQLVADIFGIPVQFQGAVDASVEGAALLANIATGVVTWQHVSQRQEAAQATQQGAIKQPSQRQAYESKYQKYRKLYRALLSEW